MARLGEPPLVAAQRILAPDMAVDHAGAADLPSWPGAYTLLLRLDQALDLTARRTRHELPPGWYAYGGSAFGPGGVGARVRRHFRRDKRPHWHVDALTGAAGILVALALKDGEECDLIRRLEASGLFGHAIDGFGSSDCPDCRSHLLAWLGPSDSE